MDTPVTSKKCSRCGEERPTSDYRVIRSQGRTRLHSWCILCQRAYMAKKWRATDSAARRAAETERVLAYQSDPRVAARRAARSGAQYRALRDLRLVHLEEYANIVLRVGRNQYTALATLRDAHREEYDGFYARRLRDAGLAA